MGQKTNPNIFRLGINKNWKTEYFEKKSQELPNYTFKDLEIKNYIERFLETKNLLLHDYKLHYSSAVINVYISYFITPNFIFQKSSSAPLLSLKKTKSSQKVTVKSFNKLNAKKTVTQRVYFTNKNLKLFEKSTILFQKVKFPNIIKKYLNFNDKTAETNLISSSKFDYPKLLAAQNLRNFQMKNDFQKLLEGLSLFTEHQYNIRVTFQCVNKTFNLTLEQIQSLKEKFLLLQKFQNIPFFKESIDVLFISVFNPKSANLLAKLISFQFKKLKRHNFFLSFLKRTLSIFITSNFSKVKGIKIVVKGRLNGAPRARHKILTMGSVPVQSILSKLDYAQTTAHNSNGSYGIKVWVLEKF